MERYPPRSSSYHYGRNQYMDRGYPPQQGYGYQQYPPPPQQRPYDYQSRPPPQMPQQPIQQMKQVQPKPIDDLPIDSMPKLVAHQVLVNPPIEITPAPSEILSSYWDN